MATLTHARSDVKTTILFDATAPRNRIKDSFGDGLVDLTEGLPTTISIFTGNRIWLVGDVWTDNVKAELRRQAKATVKKANTTPAGELSPGRITQPTPKTKAELRAFELGRRAGYGRIEAKRIMSFGGGQWNDAAIAAYWLGYRAGWTASDTERLEAQAEVDRRYDAMYAERVADGENGWDRARGGAL